jgi:hypothetical protein
MRPRVNVSARQRFVGLSACRGPLVAITLADHLVVPPERPNVVMPRQQQPDKAIAKKPTASPAPAPHPLSLAAFLSTMAARVNRLNDACIEPVTFRAIPLKPQANRKVYKGRVYCGLQDVAGRETMDATVAEQDIEAVPWGVEATLTGLVVYRVNLQGKIQPEFRIDSVAASGAARLRPRAEANRRPPRSWWTDPGSSSSRASSTTSGPSWLDYLVSTFRRCYAECVGSPSLADRPRFPVLLQPRGRTNNRQYNPPRAPPEPGQRDVSRGKMRPRRRPT